MSFFHVKPAEVRAPETLVLPDSRKRLTRFFSVAHTGTLPPELDLAWGSVDTGEAPTGWTGLRLTNRLMTDDVPPPGRDSRPIIQLIFEQIDESAETAVGGVEITHLEDGRVARVENWIQFSTGAYVPQTVGTTVSAGDASAYLQKEESADDGTVRRITRTYVYAGTIATDEQIKSGGALSIKTITSVKTVPATPSGYILIGKPTQAPNGLPVYTYTFAKGIGEVSRTTEYRLSTDTGATGMTVVTIKYLSDPATGSNPITGPGGYVLVEEEHDDQDGYRVWTAIYATGTGTVISTVELKNAGKLVIYSITAINTAPSAPAATISGTVVLVNSTTRHDRFHEGVIIYEYMWAEGKGVIQDSIRVGNDGLQEQTQVSLGTKSTPSGAVIVDESELIDGVTKYTVVAKQQAGGGDVTSAAFSLARNVPFTYPGRAKAYQKTASNGWLAIDVFLSPPIETLIPGMVAVSYQTSNSLSLSNTLWSPTDWATIEAEWIGLGNIPAFHIEALRGYRSVSDTPVSEVVSAWAGDSGGTMLGKVIFGGTTAKVTVTGGPADPVGSTFTLDANLEVAFSDTSGTKYYRKTEISAEIPSQPALPV